MYLYMDTKIFNYFLIFAIAILIFLNILANNKKYTESFQGSKKNTLDGINKSIANNANKKNDAVNSSIATAVNTSVKNSTSPNDTNKLKDMMEALSNSEALCDELEKRQENKDLLQQYEINKNTIQELDNQRKRIEELRRVLNQLRKEKAQRDVVVNRCRSKAQDELNNDYTIVKKLSDKGLLKDTSLKVNLNVSDQLKRNLSGIKMTSNNNSNKVNSTNGTDVTKRKIRRCRGVDKKKFIHADNLRGKCVGCDVDKLLDKNDYLKKDFA